MDAGIDPRTGEVYRTEQTGIRLVHDGKPIVFYPDVGFNYNHGNAAFDRAVQVLTQKVEFADPELGVRTMQASLRFALPRLSADFYSWASNVLAAGQASNNYRVVGALTVDVLDALHKLGVKPRTAALTIRDTDLLHLARVAGGNNAAGGAEMSQTIDLVVHDTALNAVFDRYQDRLTNAQPAMAGIAEILVRHTSDAFEAQGIPKWVDLAESTKAQREEAGTWPGMILHVTGTLASSYTPSSGNDYAQVTSFLPYAAIQNFGGKAGRGHSATIPARRQIPVDDNQQLLPVARDDILAFMADYLTTL